MRGVHMAAVMPIYHLTWHACLKELKIVHDFNSEYAVHNVMVAQPADI